MVWERGRSSRREKRNSQVENAAPERKTSGGQELKLGHHPGSKLRKGYSCLGWLGSLRAFPGKVEVQRKESDYGARKLEERERKTEGGEKSSSLGEPKYPQHRYRNRPSRFDFDVQFETNQ